MQGCAVGELGAGVGGLRPRRERAGDRSGDADEVHGSAGRGEGGGVRPPAQARLADAQLLGQQHPIPVEQDDGAVTAVGVRLGAAGRDHERGPRVDAGDRVLAVGDDDPRVREGATELVGGALAARRGHPQARALTVAAGPRADRPPAPGALRRGARPARAQRTGAVRAAGRRAAVGADEHRGVAGPGDLHEHRAVGQGLTRGGERRRRHPLAARLAVAGGREHDGRALPPARRDLAHPAELHEAFDVGRAGVPGEHEGRPFELLPHERGVARVHAGTQLLGQQRIAVVPDDHGADVRRRRVDRRAVSDDDRRLAVEEAEVRGVALRPRPARVTLHDHALRRMRGEHREHLVFIALVGHDDERALPAGERVERDRADELRPRAVRARRRGAGRCVEGDPGVVRESGGKVREVAQDASRPRDARRRRFRGLDVRRRGVRRPGGRSLGIRSPRIHNTGIGSRIGIGIGSLRGTGIRNSGIRTRRTGIPATRDHGVRGIRHRRHARGEPRLLGAHHALRDDEAEDVARRPGGAVGDAASEGVELRREHGDRRDDRVELGQRLARDRRLGPLDHLDEIPLDDPPRGAEGNLHAHAGHGVCAQGGRDRVVEQAVELRQRRVDQHARDERHGLGRIRDRRPRAARRPGRCAPT